MHIISSKIEHKAVLEPLEALEAKGFTISLVAAKDDGTIDLDHFNELIQPETLLVSIMHVNNETGVNAATFRNCRNP